MLFFLISKIWVLHLDTPTIFYIKALNTRYLFEIFKTFQSQIKKVLYFGIQLGINSYVFGKGSVVYV